MSSVHAGLFEVRRKCSYEAGHDLFLEWGMNKFVSSSRAVRLIDTNEVLWDCDDHLDVRKERLTVSKLAFGEL